MVGQVEERDLPQRSVCLNPRSADIRQMSPRSTCPTFSTASREEHVAEPAAAKQTKDFESCRENKSRTDQLLSTNA